VQAQQEQVEQGRTIPGNLARAGHGRGNMEPRRGQFHKHRQGQCIGNHSQLIGTGGASFTGMKP
jgi:hypothetical protein